MTPSRGVVTMCAAQACVQIAAFSVAAVLPALISAWALGNTEAGWISSIYYAAYTLAVPLLRRSRIGSTPSVSVSAPSR